MPNGTPNLKMGIQNYANLTLDGMTLDASGNDKIGYVLSNNNGSTTITGGTVLKAAEGKVAFDVYDSRNYPQVEVRVDDAVVEGKVEVSENPGKVKLEISGGTFSAELSPAWCAEGFLPVKNGGTYGVIKEALTLTAGASTQTGEGAVTLTVAPAAVTGVTVTCDVEGITVEGGENGVYTAALPNADATYTFTATVGSQTSACAVTVTAAEEPGEVPPEVPPVIDYYTLTIRYQYVDGAEAAPTVTRRMAEGSRYQGASPELEGYSADQETVTGVLNRNETITVTYTADENVEEPQTPATESPEGTESPEPTEAQPTETPTENGEPAEPQAPETEIPEESEDLGENDTPLAEVPQTGDMLWLWLLLTASSAAGLVWLFLGEKKGKRVA